MTAVPPPVPLEIVEKAAKAMHRARCLGRSSETCATDHAQARTVLAAVYGDIVEAARRDALTEAAEAIEAKRVHNHRARLDVLACVDDGCAWFDYTARIVTDLLAATAPPRAPTASVSDQGADPRTPTTPGAQIAAEGRADEPTAQADQIAELRAALDVAETQANNHAEDAILLERAVKRVRALCREAEIATAASRGDAPYRARVLVADVLAALDGTEATP